MDSPLLRMSCHICWHPWLEKGLETSLDDISHALVPNTRNLFYSPVSNCASSWPLTNTNFCYHIFCTFFWKLSCTWKQKVCYTAISELHVPIKHKSHQLQQWLTFSNLVPSFFHHPPGPYWGAKYTHQVLSSRNKQIRTFLNITSEPLHSHENQQELL